MVNQEEMKSSTEGDESECPPWSVGTRPSTGRKKKRVKSMHQAE